MPSLHAPVGFVLAPVGNEPIGVRSAAFHIDTLFPTLLVTRTRCPSNAAWKGLFSPFPVSVARTMPSLARTTLTDESDPLGTQMFEPSNTGSRGLAPTATF